MAYKCPLCLKMLNQNDELYRFCYQCETTRIFKFSEINLNNNITCSKKECRKSLKIVEEIFFAHKNCEKINPFWDGSNLNVPPNTNLDGNKISLPFQYGEKSFQHWQIKLLTKLKETKSTVKETAQNVSEIKEMWFPGMLLRATNEKRNGKRIGQIVSLIGTLKAGKTILALQTLDDEGYVSPHSKERIELVDYIFSQARRGLAIQPIFDLLRTRSQMKRNSAFFKPLPTTRENLNLYAVFFKPMAEPEGNKEKQPKAEKALSWGFISGAIKDAFKEEDSSQPFFYTLALYDVAGEDVANEVNHIDKIKQQADKIALVIDSTDLLENNGNPNWGDNLADTLETLRSLKSNPEKPFCVIFTKIDIFFQKLSSINFTDLEGFKKRLFEGNQKSIKEFLQARQPKIINIVNEHLNPTLGHLFRELLSLTENNPIFFIETSPLSENAVEHQTQPLSKGLDTFVCWALEISKSEIIS